MTAMVLLLMLCMTLCNSSEAADWQLCNWQRSNSGAVSLPTSCIDALGTAMAVPGPKQFKICFINQDANASNAEKAESACGSTFEDAAIEAIKASGEPNNKCNVNQQSVPCMCRPFGTRYPTGHPRCRSFIRRFGHVAFWNGERCECPQDPTSYQKDDGSVNSVQYEKDRCIKLMDRRNEYRDPADGKKKYYLQQGCSRIQWNIQAQGVGAITGNCVDKPGNTIACSAPPLPSTFADPTTDCLRCCDINAMGSYSGTPQDETMVKDQYNTCETQLTFSDDTRNAEMYIIPRVYTQDGASGTNVNDPSTFNLWPVWLFLGLAVGSGSAYAVSKYTSSQPAQHRPEHYFESAEDEPIKAEAAPVSHNAARRRVEQQQHLRQEESHHNEVKMWQEQRNHAPAIGVGS